MQGDAYAISGRAVTPTSCPPNTPTLMLGVEKPPFAVFPVQLQAVWGVQGICAPSRVCDGLAGDKGCSGAFWGKQPFCTKEGL